MRTPELFEALLTLTLINAKHRSSTQRDVTQSYRLIARWATFVYHQQTSCSDIEAGELLIQCIFNMISWNSPSTVSKWNCSHPKLITRTRDFICSTIVACLFFCFKRNIQLVLLINYIKTIADTFQTLILIRFHTFQRRGFQLITRMKQLRNRYNHEDCLF